MICLDVLPVYLAVQSNDRRQIGEMALLDDLPRSATVTAVDEVSVLSLPLWEFRRILRRDPDVGLDLLAVLSRRLRKAEQRATE